MPNIATAISNPATTAAVKVRSANRPSGMIGSTARRSATTKAPAPATAATARPSTTDELQAYRVPPQEASRTTAVTARASVLKPATSRCTRSGPRGGSCSSTTTASTASPPTGRLSQNAHRQPMPSVSQPPTSGPARAETANTAPMALR